MDEFLARFTLFGLPAIFIVLLLVELYKRIFGPPSKWYPLISLVSGLIVAGALALIDFVPGAEPVIMYILAGLMLGAGAMGLYSGAKAIQGFKSVPPGTDVVEPTGKAYTVPDNK